MLPGNPEIGGTGAHDSHNVLHDAMLSIDSLRTDVREWHEGLQWGYEEPEWKEEADAAMERRASGLLGTGKFEELDQLAEDGKFSNEADEEEREANKPWWADPNLDPMNMDEDDSTDMDEEGSAAMVEKDSTMMNKEDRVTVDQKHPMPVDKEHPMTGDKAELLDASV